MNVSRLFYACVALASAPTLCHRLEAQRISDSLAAAIDSAPRIRVRVSSGWMVLNHPQVRQDSLTFGTSQGLDRGGRSVALRAPLALAAVQEIQWPSGNRAGKGALWGGAMGAPRNSASSPVHLRFIPTG
jgi:hypothetical protein